MRRHLLLLSLLTLPLFGQQSVGPIVTIIPTTSASTGAPTAVGQLRFRDMQTSVNYEGFKAANTLSSNLMWQLPSSDTAGCLVSDGSLHLSIDAACTASSGSGLWVNAGSNPNNVYLSNTSYSVQSLLIEDQTASTGNTNFSIQAGAGQSGDFFDVLSASSAKIFDIDSTGNFIFGADNVYSIGSNATRPLALYAATQIESPDVRIDYRVAGTVADYFDIVSGGTTHVFEIKDSSAANIVEYQDFVTPQWNFTGTVIPSMTATYDLGNSGNMWRNLYLSGTCTGCSPTDMMTTDTPQSPTGVKTWSADILFGTDNTYNIGSSATRPQGVWAATQMESPDFRVDYRVGGSVADYFDIVSGGATHVFEIKDSSSANIVEYQDFVTPQWNFTGTVIPSAGATYDLGSSTGNPWRNGYFAQTVDVKNTTTGGVATVTANATSSTGFSQFSLINDVHEWDLSTGGSGTGSDFDFYIFDRTNTSFPLKISNSDMVTIANLTVGSCTGCSSGTAPVFNATNTGASITFQNSNGNFQVNGNGAASFSGVISSIAGVNVTTGCSMYDCFQTQGGYNADDTGGTACAFSTNATCVIAAPFGGFASSLTIGSITPSADNTYADGSGNHWKTVASYDFVAYTASGTAHAFELNNGNGFIQGNGNFLLGGGTFLGDVGLTTGNFFVVGGNAGLTCSGTPTSSFASVGGIVTHC